MLTSAKASRGPQEQAASVLSSPLEEQTNFAEQIVSRFLNLRVFLEQGSIALSPSSLGAPTILMTMAVADSVHFLTGYYNRFETTGDLPPHGASVRRGDPGFAALRAARTAMRLDATSPKFAFRAA